MNATENQPVSYALVANRRCSAAPNVELPLSRVQSSGAAWNAEAPQSFAVSVQSGRPFTTARFVEGIWSSTRTIHEKAII